MKFARLDTRIGLCRQHTNNWYQQKRASFGSLSSCFPLSLLFLIIVYQYSKSFTNKSPHSFFPEQTKMNTTTSNNLNHTSSSSGGSDDDAIPSTAITTTTTTMTSPKPTPPPPSVDESFQSLFPTYSYSSFSHHMDQLDNYGDITNMDLDEALDGRCATSTVCKSAILSG